MSLSIDLWKIIIGQIELTDQLNLRCVSKYFHLNLMYDTDKLDFNEIFERIKTYLTKKDVSPIDILKHFIKSNKVTIPEIISSVKMIKRNRIFREENCLVHNIEHLYDGIVCCLLCDKRYSCRKCHKRSLRQRCLYAGCSAGRENIQCSVCGNYVTTLICNRCRSDMCHCGCPCGCCC